MPDLPTIGDNQDDKDEDEEDKLMPAPAPAAKPLGSAALAQSDPLAAHPDEGQEVYQGDKLHQLKRNARKIVVSRNVLEPKDKSGALLLQLPHLDPPYHLRHPCAPVGVKNESIKRPWTIFLRPVYHFTVNKTLFDFRQFLEWLTHPTATGLAARVPAQVGNAKRREAIYIFMELKEGQENVLVQRFYCVVDLVHGIIVACDLLWAVVDKQARYQSETGTSKNDFTTARLHHVSQQINDTSAFNQLPPAQQAALRQAQKDCQPPKTGMGALYKRLMEDLAQFPALKRKMVTRPPFLTYLQEGARWLHLILEYKVRIIAYLVFAIHTLPTGSILSDCVNNFESLTKILLSIKALPKTYTQDLGQHDSLSTHAIPMLVLLLRGNKAQGPMNVPWGKNNTAVVNRGQASDAATFRRVKTSLISRTTLPVNIPIGMVQLLGLDTV